MNNTPEIYEMEIRVTKDDLDELQHVNNVRYVQWIQDIAKVYWKNRAEKEFQE